MTDETYEYYFGKYGLGRHNRLDGYMIIHENKGQTRVVFYNSQDRLHREDGPAVINGHGDRIWAIDGYRHRTDGPALILHTGEQYWYDHGDFHRLDGPAMINTLSTNGSWYVNDYNITSQITAWAEQNQIDLINICQIVKVNLVLFCPSSNL